MMLKTHLVFSFLIGLVIINYLDFSNKYLFLAILTFASVLPDIDLPRSKIGKKFGFISRIINIFFGHRGLFHSLFLGLILFFVFYYFNLKLIAIAVLIGYISHLLMDGLTKEGVLFFTPFSSLRLKGFIRTGSFFEYLLFFVLIILVVVQIRFMF